MRKNVNYNKRAMYFIILVVILFFGIFIAQITNSFYKNQDLERQVKSLEKQIEAEQARQLDLLEEQNYVNSKQFIEDTAREKLNLLYEDEIIFEEELE